MTSAVCERCDAEIDRAARRCPDCGYEPAETRSATVIAVCAAAVFLGSLALLASVPLGTVPVVGAAVAASTAKTFGLPGVLVSAPLLVGYRRQDRRTPTDSTIF